MKTKRVLGISILSLLLSFYPASNNIFAQDTAKLSKKEVRRIERKKRKEEKEKQATAQRKKLSKMLREKEFVFQADKIYFKGNSITVTPDVNFVAVNKDDVIYQSGFQGLIGWNGVGGITGKGKLEQYKFDEGKNRKSPLSVSAQIEPKGPGGKLFFHLTVMDNGSADLDLTLSNGTIRMTGFINSPEKSKVFVGQSVY
jgi:hypothetical protein